MNSLSKSYHSLTSNPSSDSNVLASHGTHSSPIQPLSKNTLTSLHKTHVSLWSYHHFVDTRSVVPTYFLLVVYFRILLSVRFLVITNGAVVNSCNGLICILFGSHNLKSHISTYWFCLWNPATKTTSAEFGTFDRHFRSSPIFDAICAMLTFGYDILTGTYKVVASLPERNVDRRYQVRIHSLGDNWYGEILIVSLWLL
jgi:hypothetical protein